MAFSSPLLELSDFTLTSLWVWLDQVGEASAPAINVDLLGSRIFCIILSAQTPFLAVGHMLTELSRIEQVSLILLCCKYSPLNTT